MRTIGLKPGDPVLVIRRAAGQETVHNGLVLYLSMDEAIAGASGEMPIGVTFVRGEWGPEAWCEVPHFTSPGWATTRSGCAYEELPAPFGVCRYCGCTERRACVDGNGEPCRWMDADQTVCSSFSCFERLTEDQVALDGFVPAGRSVL